MFEKMVHLINWMNGLRSTLYVWFGVSEWTGTTLVFLHYYILPRPTPPHIYFIDFGVFGRERRFYASMRWNYRIFNSSNYQYKCCKDIKFRFRLRYIYEQRDRERKLMPRSNMKRQCNKIKHTNSYRSFSS